MLLWHLDYFGETSCDSLRGEKGATVTYLMRDKAEYERVAQYVIRQMHLDDKPVEGIRERLSRNVKCLSETDGVERSEVYTRIAGDAILGIVGKRISEQK